jgi:hypothetical protein
LRSGSRKNVIHSSRRSGDRLDEPARSARFRAERAWLRAGGPMHRDAADGRAVVRLAGLGRRVARISMRPGLMSGRSPSSRRVARRVLDSNERPSPLRDAGSVISSAVSALPLHPLEVRMLAVRGKEVVRL